LQQGELKKTDKKTRTKPNKVTQITGAGQMNVRKDLLLFECVPLHAEGMLVFHHISSATYCCIPAQRCWAQQIMELGDLHLLRVFVQVDVKNHSPFSFCLSVPISVSPAFMSP